MGFVYLLALHVIFWTCCLVVMCSWTSTITLLQVTCCRYVIVSFHCWTGKWSQASRESCLYLVQAVSLSWGRNEVPLFSQSSSHFLKHAVHLLMCTRNERYLICDKISTTTTTTTTTTATTTTTTTATATFSSSNTANIMMMIIITSGQSNFT